MAAALSAVVVAGAALQVWWLSGAGVAAFLSAILVVALDADRRVRRMRPLGRQPGARGPARRSTAPPEPPPPPESNAVGTVRLLQAQYVGRLDRMQSSLDRAVAEMSRQRRDDA